jgi:hypothetical protein
MGWVAHDTDLYTVGRGIVYFDRFDSNGLPTGVRDVGNAPGFILTPEIEKLKHYSSRAGIKKADKVIVIQQGLMAKFTLDEYDKENLALALFGTVTGNALDLLSQNQIEGELRFFGNPATGPTYYIYLWKVLLSCNSDVNFISDEWGTIDFEAEIQDDTANHPDTPYGRIEQIIGS